MSDLFPCMSLASPHALLATEVEELAEVAEAGGKSCLGLAIP